MPLVKCEHCNKTILDSGRACSNCRRLIKSNPNKMKIIKIISSMRMFGKYEAVGFLLIVIGILGMFSGTLFSTHEMMAWIFILLVPIGFVILLVGKFA